MGREPRAGPGIPLMDTHCRHFPGLGKASQRSGLGSQPKSHICLQASRPRSHRIFFPHFLKLILKEDVKEENICLNAE